MLVVSSKSGSTVETDSAKRAFEAAFRDLGIDPLERIVVVTDPGSPLDVAARADGYRVFNADPTVGGRYSALTAFGLVPTGLAGVDIAELLDEAEATLLEVAIDSADNPALVLAAAIAGGEPRRDKLGLVTDGTHIVGLPDWIEQLVAESTGKEGTGILPVVLLPVSPEVENTPGRPADRAPRRRGERVPLPRAPRGRDPRQRLARRAARRLGVRDRDRRTDAGDQPVRPARRRIRQDRRARSARRAPRAHRPRVRGGRRRGARLGPRARGIRNRRRRARRAVGAGARRRLRVDPGVRQPPRPAAARRVCANSSPPTPVARPRSAGDPRFLHSTGQYHKGGPANGVFLQILERTDVDLEIPGRPFTFGQLIEAQAAGDASVLADGHGRPVVTLTLTDPQVEVLTLFEAAQ